MRRFGVSTERQVATFATKSNYMSRVLVARVKAAKGVPILRPQL